MKADKISLILCVINLCVGLWLLKAVNQLHEIANAPPNEVTIEDTIKEEDRSFMSLNPAEGLMSALEYYGIKHPKIVYAQAVLETGNFTSSVLTNNNNLFGLYDSSKGSYYTFSHWSESVKAYRDFIQYRYKPPNNVYNKSNYYQFLKNIGYARDPKYIIKIQEIVNQI